MASIEISRNFTHLLDTYISLARDNAALDAIAHEETWSHGIQVARHARIIEQALPETARDNVASDLEHLRSLAINSQAATAAAHRAGAEMRRYYKSRVNAAEEAITELRACILGYTR